MSPAAENVQQARRLIADLELPAEPCQTDAHPNRAPASSLNNDQQAAVNRYRADQSMPDSWPCQNLLSAVLNLVQTSVDAVGFYVAQSLLENKRKDYAFWRQFHEKPRISPGYPGQSLLQYAARGDTVCSGNLRDS